MSIRLQENEIAQVIELLSLERLSVFRNTQRDDISLITIHAQVMTISAEIMPIISLIEIFLRNAISNKIENTFNSKDWLINPISGLHWKTSEEKKIKDAKKAAQKALYSKMKSRQKITLDINISPNILSSNPSHIKKIKLRQGGIIITNDQVIAQMTIFFWKRLLSDDYEATLWKRCLRKIFPNKSIDRSIVGAHLEVIYQSRNRVAHHEPIYGNRLTKLIESMEFICSNFLNESPETYDGILKILLSKNIVSLKNEADILSGILQ